VSYAGTAQAEYESYADQGFVIVMLMIDGQSDVNLWVDKYGFTFPVLADADWVGSNNIGLGGGIPHHILIGRDMTVRVLGNQPGGGEIQSALDEEWPDVDRPEPPVLDEIDDEDDGTMMPTSGNPFLVEGGPDYETANMCAASPAGRGSWFAVAVLPALFLIRRRR
jgi:MYXO-CTERM domain-containing protein